MVEKGRGVKFFVRVRLLSGQVFSRFGELCLAGSHGGGITDALVVLLLCAKLVVAISSEVILVFFFELIVSRPKRRRETGFEAGDDELTGRRVAPRRSAFR